MQLIKKPKIDLVLKAHKGAARQEVQQKDSNTNKFKILSCFKEFETANFETRNPKMRFSIKYNTSTLSGNICKTQESGLAFLQTAKKSLSSSSLQLTENLSQAVTGIATEYCSCPLTQEVGN